MPEASIAHNTCCITFVLEEQALYLVGVHCWAGGSIAPAVEHLYGCLHTPPSLLQAVICYLLTAAWNAQPFSKPKVS
jgi:hypothetical protein